MKKKTSTLVITIFVILAGSALILLGLMRSNFDYYITIDQLKDSKSTPLVATVRILGQVSPDTWKPAGQVGSYTFTLQDQDQTLPVEYTGSPINPASGQQIVVEGHLADNGTFVSQKIMTKCESKYSGKPRGEH